MLIDTHAHLNFNTYKEDLDKVVKRTLENNVWIINVGSQYETSKRAVEIAGKYEKGVYAAVGLHPIHANEEKYNLERYKELIIKGGLVKVVAIGEIGLDYKLEYVSFKEKQKTVFLKQLALAKELNLPVIFHCRMAHEDLIEILNTKYKIQDTAPRGVIHCFTGTWEQAQQYLEMGFYLGFNGIIFKLNLDKIIEKTPLDKILIETDCPYLIPLPAVALLGLRSRSYFGEGGAEAGPPPYRNEPLYVKYVAEKIAKIKNTNFGEVAKITTENAKKLFKI